MSTPSPDDLAALSAAWRAFGSKGNGRPMSTSPDDSGALSPAERDFALRRMPVDIPAPRRTVPEALARLRAFERALSSNYPMSGALLSDLVSDLEKALK